MTDRAIRTLVRDYALNYLDTKPGCQINEAEMEISLHLREDFPNTCAVLLDSLSEQLPLLHTLRGGSNV